MYTVAGGGSTTSTSSPLAFVATLPGIRQAAGQLERTAQVGAAGRRLDRRQPLAEQPAIRREFLHDLRLVAKLMIIAVMPESIWSIRPSASCFASSSRFAALVDVGRRHAGRVVDQEDEPLAFEPAPFPTRPQQREHRQPDQQQLQKHQQILPQPLPQAVDVQVFDRPLPEIRARHFERLPLELEEIERNDRRRHERHQHPLPSRERVAEEFRHRTRPRRRR